MILNLVLIAVGLASGSDAALAQQQTDSRRASACAASFAVLPTYIAEGRKMGLGDRETVPPRSLEDFKDNWRTAPPDELIEAFRSEPAKGFLALCPKQRAAAASIGFVLDKAGWSDPKIDAFLTVDLAVLSRDGDEALVSHSGANRGFGGHCSLSYLRRMNGKWVIVDQRPTCVV